MKFFMISSRTDLFIHSNILQYYSNPHKQHTEKDFYRIFQTKKAEADRSLSPAASAFTYTFLSTFFQKSLYCTSHRNIVNLTWLKSRASRRFRRQTEYRRIRL